MVSFTCNACGQTVKKSKVEKHYQTECRDCSVLSCLDCGKDFHGDEYASHTSCISEAEKYQGKLYKDSNRGQPPKGEKKQQVWLEKVKEAAAVSSPTTNPRLARLLERLQEYTNIPRKMKKFQNFVKNSLNVRDQKTLDELWTMFSGIKSGSDSTATTGPGAAETCAVEDSTVAVDDQVEVDKAKKKKKKRCSEMDDSESIPSVVVDEKSVVDVEEDISCSTKKHKKKKHHHIKESEDVTTNTNQLDIQLLSDSQPPVAVEQSVSKKRKKNKKKSPEQDADEQDTVEDGQGTDNGVEENINHWVSSITDSAVVKKKDRHKHCEDVASRGLDGHNDDESTTVSTDVPLKDSKKKSKSIKRDVDVVDADQEVMEDNEVTIVEQKKKRKRKALTEYVSVEKKTKLLQIGDDETELTSVKKHKKKKLIE